MNYADKMGPYAQKSMFFAEIIGIYAQIPLFYADIRTIIINQKERLSCGGVPFDVLPKLFVCDNNFHLKQS
ncbi:hypothetical protein ACM26V_14550 [Salipaludibacillus sp. HK11]|uniref:hypothetical protein n=1 Tax=Salipaludibacillus sp. HK11 TaxID=3394320 RepID=UPI0039FBC3C6